VVFVAYHLNKKNTIRYDGRLTPKIYIEIYKNLREFYQKIQLIRLDS